MPALSTYAPAGVTITTNTATLTHTVRGNGTTTAVVIDSQPDDVNGYTIVCENGAYIAFNYAGTFGSNDRLTTIIERGSFTEGSNTIAGAGRPGRTAYYSNQGRIRGTESTNPLTITNVDWYIDSAASGNATQAREAAWHVSSGASDDGGRLVVFDGVRVEGFMLDTQWTNRRATCRINAARGFGLSIWMKSSDNSVPFTIGLQTTPETALAGLVLLRGATTATKGALQYNLWDSTENPILRLTNADVLGVGNLNAADDRATTTIELIDPVGNPGKLGSPFSGGSLAWGLVRIFRTQTFNYSGPNVTWAGTEHLILDNVTAGAPSWAEPANVQSNSNGTFTAVLAVRESAHGSIAWANNYRNYTATFPGSFTARRKTVSFTVAETGALSDINETLTHESLAGGAAITSFTAASDNRIDNLDKLFRAMKTHEAAHPGLSQGYAYMIRNDRDEYEVKQHDGTDGDVNFATTSHSTYFNNTSSSTLTVYNVPANASIGAGTAAGLKVDDLILSSGVTANFPRETSTGKIRRVTITGEADWKGTAYTVTGTNLGGLKSFTSADLTHSFLTSSTGTLILALARAGYTPTRLEVSINSATDPLSVAFSIAGGAIQTFAETGGTKYDAMLAVSGNGGVEYDVNWSASPDVPSARILMPDKAISCETAYALFQKGLETLAGLEFIAGGGNIVNTEVLESSGAFLFMGAHTQLKRQAAGNNNAALEGFAVSSSGVWVDDSNGAVVYDPGVNLSTLEADIKAVKDKVVVDFQSGVAGTQDLSSMLNTILTAANAGGGGGGASVADIVAGIKAADFGSASGTQTLESILGAIQGAVATDFDTSEAGTQTLKQRLDDLHASHGLIQSAISNIPAAPTPPTTTAIAGAVWGHASDIDTGTDGVQTPASLLAKAANQAAEAHTAVDNLTIPTASTIAQEVLADMQTTDISQSDTGVQSIASQLNSLVKMTQEVYPGVSFKEIIQALAALTGGTTTVNNDTNQVTYKNLDSARTDAIRITYGAEDGQRTTSTLL